MNIPFLKFTKLYYVFSAILVLASAFCIFSFGLNLGIDFSGGSILEVDFENRPSNSVIQEKIKDINLGEVVIQPIGEKGVILKMREINDEIHQNVISKLNEISTLKELSFENIGPIISQELRQKTMLLILISFLALLLYISISFRKVSHPLSSWQYGIVSTICLVFDVLIVIGFFAILGKLYNAQFNIPIITAILTILGYTINDKVIIFDRVRENILRKTEKDFKDLVNRSLNETLIRSLSTGACTLLVLFAIFLFGGETLRYFSLVLIIGIVIGTYSSLFLASPILVSWLRWREKRRGI